MAAEQHSIASYVSSKRGEPGVFEKIDMTLPNTNNIRKKMVVHAIVCCDENGEHISPEDQVIGAFTGFMHSISPPAERSKAYYFLTLPKSPSKKVVFTMMENAAEAANLKNMPFIHFSGDQPVYAFLEELKAEFPEKF